MKKTSLKIVLLSWMVLLFSSCSNNKNMIRTETVNNLEIEKYMGIWYEIARYPHSFEKDLVGVTATYIPEANGKLTEKLK